jgi:hypothetical protein
MNQPSPADEPSGTVADQATPTEVPVHHPRFPVPLGMVLLVVLCGLAGPACYFGLAILRNYGLLS